MKRLFKWESRHRTHSTRCGHHYCTDCRKRRGSNRGNRNERHQVKTFLRVSKSSIEE